ncbi:MAG TPA: hypothetical protein ENI49_04400, partial [Thermoplasmatales archaeon]|nr:hypothetical protein [Thermoplasmatales archaeon]
QRENEIGLGGGQGPIFWSPDGKKLCYYSKVDLLYDRPLEISIKDINGNEVKRIPIGDSCIYLLDWHPDGNKFLCRKGYIASSGYVYITGIFSFEIKDNTISNMIQLGDPEAYGIGEDAIYSPDGRITYLKSDGVYIYGSDGRNPRKIINERFSSLLGWSRDGTLLSMLTLDNRLCILNIDDGTKFLVSGYFNEWSTGWMPSPLSPDNSKIAYWGGNSLYVSNLDGTGKIKIATAEGTISPPSWSPDGKRIVYGVKDSIYIANADGSNITYLHPGNSPKWSP